MSDTAPHFACLYRPPSPTDATPGGGRPPASLVDVAREFSPRYQQHGADAIVLDVSGLDRLLGPPRIIGEEIRRDAAGRGIRGHVAVSASRTTALVAASARAGITIVRPGEEAAALAAVPIAVLEQVAARLDTTAAADPARRSEAAAAAEGLAVRALRAWGLRTLGEFAALPPAQVRARLGRWGVALQVIARGEDRSPLVPDLPEERFQSSADLEWPIEGLEPLSFVLTRLLEPLSTQLERRDRGAAVLHVALGLVSKDEHVRRLQLPAPLRDVRSLRTLALLDLESHPPDAAIDRVTVTIEPTPGRVLQYTLFARAQAAPEQLTTLLARLGALMGQDRIGAPALIDSHRPGAFAMTPFDVDERSNTRAPSPLSSPVSALRRCRYPVPARVVIDGDRLVRLTTDRRGFAGGEVIHASGPWRTSGEWWSEASTAWNRDEWDVALSDGGMYRVFRDRDGDRWFIDAIVD